MAEINTVPQGIANTGAATIYGESQAANQLLDTLQYNQQINQQQEALKRQQAQQLAQNYQKNLLKVEGGLYWQPEFNKRYQQHFDKGLQLRSLGIDPYNYNANDPMETKIAEDYLLERQGILSDTASRKALEENVSKQFGLIKANPSNYYSSDIQALNDYVSNPFSQAIQGQVPTLTERFQPNSVLSKVTPAQIGNEVVVGNQRIKSVTALPDATRTAIVSAYQNDPATARWVDEMTGRQGFTIRDLENIPRGKEAIKKDLEAQYKGNPRLREDLASNGITPNTEAYNRFVNTETERLYNAKTAWDRQIENDLNQVLPKVKEMSSTLPDFTLENQQFRRNADARANQANSRANARFNDWEKEKKDNNTYDTFLDRANRLDPNAVAELKTVLNEVAGANVRRIYEDTIKIDGKNRKIKDALVIDIPVETERVVKDANGQDVTDADGVTKKEKVMTNKRYLIGNPNGDRQGKILLNQILQRAKSFGAQKQNKVLPYNQVESDTQLEDWED